MKDIKVSLNNIAAKRQFNNKETEFIGSIIAESPKVICRNDIRSFTEKVGANGCTFCPATFRDSVRSKETFEQSQLLTLYFDSKDISFSEIKARADSYDLPILFAYDTFSFGNRIKFTVVFLNDVSLTQLKLANIMSEALLTIFPEADSRSRDVTEIFHGGNRLLYFNESIPTINIYSLIMNMCLCLRDKYGDNHKRNVYEFSARTGLELTARKMLDVSIIETTEDLSQNESLSPNPNIYIIENGDKPSLKSLEGIIPKNYYVLNGSKCSLITQLSSSKKKKRTHLEHRSTILNEIGIDCQLFKEFEEGSRRLDKDELFELSTNLIQIESGSARFMALLRKHSYFGGTDKKYNDWEYYLSYMKKTDHQPTSCDRFCPYKHQCKHAQNILSTIKPKQHSTKKLANCENDNFYDVDEAAEDFKEKLATALVVKDSNIHIINASTGTGKSTAVINLMVKNPELRYLVAFSTNELKNEKYAIAVSQGVNAVRSPSLLEDKDKLPKEIWERLDYLYQIGKPHAVTSYIDEIINRREVDKSCLSVLRKYQKEIAEFYSTKCHTFTTHSRLFTLDYWYLKRFDAIIFDEDPILNCIIPNQVEIPISKLSKVAAEIEQNSHLAKKIKTAAKAAEKETLFTLSRINYDDAYDAISTPIDIASFCLAEKFLYKRKSDESNLWESNIPEDSIVFFKPFQLQHRIKYIILSATANRTICNYCFGLTHKVVFHDCKQAKHKGTFAQYAELPTSRAYFDKNPGLLNDLIDFSGFEDVITFRKYGIGKHYIGKITGIDTLKGKDLAVLATPHQPPWLYKLFAYTLRREKFFDVTAKMRYQPVRHNGFSFWFMTFDNDSEILRKIQFWMIESELVQAVGRARLTRERSTVNVFSNFPLLQAIQRKLPKHILTKYVVDKN